MISWNTEELLAKFRQIEYQNLTDIFREAIDKSLQILKSSTLQNLQATGVNVNSPIKSHGQQYPALVKGVIAETAIDGTKGRVRVAPASKQGYRNVEGGSHALKWFEQGTAKRYRKPAGTYKARDQYGHIHKYKREVAEGKTGSIKTYGFFDQAINSTAEEVNRSLEENIMRALNQIWNS